MSNRFETVMDVEAGGGSLLGVTVDEYRLMQFEAGMLYLELRCVKADVKALQECPDFWAWWRMAWDSRGMVPLTRMALGFVDRVEALAEWEASHDAAAIVDAVPAFVRRAAK